MFEAVVVESSHEEFIARDVFMAYISKREQADDHGGGISVFARLQAVGRDQEYGNQ